MLQNGDFSDGWQDMPPTEHYLTNQQPNGWALEWLPIGASLFGDGTKAAGVPECVHKLAMQLPPNEQMGQRDALILAGTAVYKIFHSGAAFGAQLSQTVTGLEPFTKATLTVPIQVHRHGGGDAYGAESGAWVNGAGYWKHSGVMGDRRWYPHEVRFIVPESGIAEIVIRVKSKWPSPKDFFIDGIVLEAQEAVDDGWQPPAEPPIVQEAIVIAVPKGYKVQIDEGIDATFVNIFPEIAENGRFLFSSADIDIDALDAELKRREMGGGG